MRKTIHCIYVGKFVFLKLFIMPDTCRLGPAVTPKMPVVSVVINGWEPLAIVLKSSILDVAAVLDPSPYLQSPRKEVIMRFKVIIRTIIYIKRRTINIALFLNVFLGSFQELKKDIYISSPAGGILRKRCFKIFRKKNIVHEKL